MRKTLLLLSLMISSGLFAQLPIDLLKPIPRITSFDEYEGSMYLKSRYKESSVVDEKSGTFDAKLRYNIYTDGLEFSRNSKLYEIKKSTTIHARIDGDYFYYCNFKNQRGLNRDGYYILVELNDKYRIYKRLTIDIVEPSHNLIKKIDEVGKLKMHSTYYIEEAGVVMQLPLDKKDILVTFSDKESELKKYLKKEKIRLKKEEDLIRFVARYNALKSTEINASQSLLSNTLRRD